MLSEYPKLPNQWLWAMLTRMQEQERCLVQQSHRLYPIDRYVDYTYV